MDGSYGNVFPTSRAMAPGAPAPSANQYKVNVNRQKTKKWANFKPQNYDGDDWGSDYDEPANDPEPPLPPKPLGPRQPGAHSPTTRPFQPAGSPPLRTHNQTYMGPSSARPGQTSTFPGSPSLPVGPPRRVTEPVGPPQHHTQGHSQPPFSADAARASPSPHSPHPLPSQLPPSKSSIGPNDGANTLEAVRQSSASPRAADSSKPWMEARSASPRNASPMVSPTKPLPFIRPADVYQRMEEERARGRQPLDAGRLTADTVGGSAVSGTQAQGGAQPRSVVSPAVGDINTTRSREPDSGLAPVAERQSEYGMEGFLASYGVGEGPSAEVPASSEQVQSAEPQKSVEPLSPVNIRRFSTSPQLPDLTRMSGFGEDLFSSSLFPASGLRSPVSDSMPLATVGEDVPDSAKSTAVGADASGQSVGAATPQGMTSRTAKEADSASMEKGSQLSSTVGGGADALSSQADEPDQDQPVALSSHQATAQPVLQVADQQAPAADTAREAASRNEERPAADTLAVRPHLPGGWVSETPSTPGEGAASSAVGPAQETPDKAPEAEGRHDADAQSEPVSLNVPGSRQSAPEADAAGEAKEGEKSPIPAPLHPTSPQPRSPLGKPSPVATGESDMSSQQPPPEIEARKESPSLESPRTERSEITPTAPLNPHRTPDSSNTAPPILSPPPLTTGPTLDTEAHSPVKDSDKLSEEIMKSLRPMQPGSGLSEEAEGSTAAYHAAAADPTRESSYLGDVYGDYWSATEDKAEPGLLTLGKTVDAEKAGPGSSPAPVKVPEGSAVASETAGSSTAPAASPAPLVKDSNHRSESAPRAGLQRRFSWEALPEEATPTTLPSPGLILSPPAEQLVEQKPLGSGADNMAAPSTGQFGGSKTEPSQPSPGLEVAKSLEDLRAESAPELNLAATLSPTPDPDRRTQPSPPVSDLTDSQAGDKGPSLADEKIVLQDPSHSARTPPPLEQHPVFAAQPQRPPPPKDELPSVPSPKNMNIIGFRTIMEMPSPSERIKHYTETRWQFATVDTGLDDWLRAMLARHPEHANASWSFQAAAAGAGAPHAQQQGGGGGQGGGASGQVAAAHGPRSPAAHLHMPHLQHGLSGLGHSSGQVGTKSKELLMAAGKAGKGLFSKGRNKLRGTGS